jgi:putative transposase
MTSQRHEVWDADCAAEPWDEFGKRQQAREAGDGTNGDWRCLMPHSYTSLLYHIVFSTKERYPFLNLDVRARVHDYLGGAVRSEGGTSLIVNGVADHVHILARLRQDKAVADVLRDNSSGWIHDHFPGLSKFAWQGGYAAFTVSKSQIQVVQRYIANQEAHHQKVTFQEELIALLKAHEIEFDERYLSA